MKERLLEADANLDYKDVDMETAPYFEVLKELEEIDPADPQYPLGHKPLEMKDISER